MTKPFLDLIERARDGDDEAVASLIGPHLSAMTAFVRMRLPADVKQRESAVDVVQSVCRQIIEDLPGIKASDETSFKAWLFTALRNELLNKLDYHRAMKRNVKREVDQSFSALVTDLDLARSYGQAATPSRTLAAREEVARIEAAFDQLPQDYSEVILCVGVAKLSYQ